MGALGGAAHQKDILERIMGIPQERFSNAPRHGKSMCLYRRTWRREFKVARLIPQERIQRRTADEIVDVPVPKTREQIVAAVSSSTRTLFRVTVEQSVDNHVPRSMEEICGRLRNETKHIEVDHGQCSG